MEINSDLKDEELNFLYQEIYKRKPDLKIDENNTTIFSQFISLVAYTEELAFANTIRF